MTEHTQTVVEQMEIIGPDYTLAYSALARRVAAVDALISNGSTASFAIKNEIEEAMLVIKQVETPFAYVVNR
jgi:hypothetical protein